VPRLTKVLDHTVIPATSAGDPVVVKAVAVQLAVKDNPVAADQLVVLVPFQVPVPPTQYLFAITQQGWGFHPRRIKLHRLYHACNLVVEPLLL